MVFQVTFSRILTIPAQWLLYGLTCPLAQSRYWGQFTITAIQGTSTGVAVTGVIMFERRMKKELKQHHATFKLLSFKGVVGIEGLQSFLFPLLAYKGVFFPKPPYHVSWFDFDKGLPEFLLVWEMTLVAILFLRSFSFSPYLLEVRQGAPVTASAGAAFLEVFDMRDIWRGFWYMFTSWYICSPHGLHHEKTWIFIDQTRMGPIFSPMKIKNPTQEKWLCDGPAFSTQSLQHRRQSSENSIQIVKHWDVPRLCAFAVGGPAISALHLVCE